MHSILEILHFRFASVVLHFENVWKENIFVSLLVQWKSCHSLKISRKCFKLHHRHKPAWTSLFTAKLESTCWTFCQVWRSLARVLLFKRLSSRLWRKMVGVFLQFSSGMQQSLIFYSKGEFCSWPLASFIRAFKLCFICLPLVRSTRLKTLDAVCISGWSWLQAVVCLCSVSLWTDVRSL